MPAVNAEIDGDDIVYKNHYDIGVAVGTEQGLVVPVVRDADAMSFAEIEKEIAALGRKARDGKLTIDELSGGTFTISNGGVYGSLLSTPILNPPQSAILGMHKIEGRPIAVGDRRRRIEIRPMMYVALTYDHRIVDGREAVTFLVRIKECVEDPARHAARDLRWRLPERYDRRRIGAGPGGYVAAIRAAQLGMRTSPASRSARRSAARASTSAAFRRRRCCSHREIRRGAARSGRARRQGRRGRARPGRDDGAQGQGCRDLTRGVEFLFRKNKVDWLKGTAPHRGARPGRGRQARRARRSRPARS